MKYIQRILFFLLAAFNIFLTGFLFIGCFQDIANPEIPWQADNLGWMYHHPLNYTIVNITEAILIILCLWYARLRHHQQPWQSVIILSYPLLYFIGLNIYLAFTL